MQTENMFFNLTIFKACQLLSDTTANAIETLFPKDPRMLRFADFIRDWDSWFDVHNSNSKTHGAKPLKAGYEGLTYWFSHKNSILQQGLEIRCFWFQKKTVQLKTALRKVYAYVLKGIFFRKTVYLQGFLPKSAYLKVTVM